MRVAVIGSRTYTDTQFIFDNLDKIDDKRGIDFIVSGGARGADIRSRWWANNKSKQLLEFLPNWNMYGKSAGFIRNEKIVDNADLVLAFWDGESKGTKHSIDLAIKKNIRIITFVGRQICDEFTVL